jgi:molybdopterin-binding protein
MRPPDPGQARKQAIPSATRRQGSEVVAMIKASDVMPAVD